MLKLDNKETNIFEQFPKLKEIPQDRFPQHVHIIPDGNGRWASEFHKLPLFGHKKGAQVLKKVIRALDKLPINTVSVWGFSADNWKRPNDEIKGLMTIFEKTVKEMQKELIAKETRFFHLGRKDRIPKSLRKILEETEEMTKNFKKKKFTIAIDFGGVDQEIRIMKKIQELPKNTEISLELLNKLRDGKGQIKPADLIIRTSGENRTSDLGWIAQNAEFYSIKKLLPDCDTKDFIKALVDYSKRERRFGGRLNHGITTI
nr:di-trans,poly-cis-decaprenylcistransferase [Candidatus Levybacteria bacterium]